MSATLSPAGGEPDGCRYLTLAQAAAELPGRPHLSTLHRWRLRGVRGVRLRTCVVGGRRFTTHRWLRDFRDATTAAAAPGATDATATAPRRESAIRRAEDELARDGI
ncbi:hypothetical protein Mal64_37830 [Pseudobythopirellula maris]|uniref:Uncharacterized protein n=1 Tax=Pseudobythopirellula maris TaxID=2527991 RepID=A0A5C5ZFU3_9BACT|nr:DUF1580 domain-containing protein [Pseudobythopirellula maris]TWT86244.1 hypothetical protein Mal64_37830 [Pseudobythopirellula maris]